MMSSEYTGPLPTVSEESDDGRRGWQTVDKTVFFVSGGIIVVVCLLGIFFTEQVTEVAGALLGWVTSTFGWLFILGATGFVLFSLVLAFGRYGNIPLSREGETTEFSTLSWIAMMFSAGMGIGLMFFGVYEPVTHLASPPPFVDAAPGSPEAANSAMAYTLFHWGLHPWAIYSVVGLALAYSTYRMGRGNLMSSPFQALFGKERIEKKGWGKPIDILAIICTKFGSATSLGLGALQIAAGLALLRTGQFQENPGAAAPILIICVLTVGVVISAASGVSRGIKWLSNTNMVLAAVLLVFVFVLGPTVFILDLVPASIGDYLANLVPMSFHSAVFGGTEWLASWTIFYWAWWISWTPFVGTFIAKISRGRTIKEFVLGVLLVPTSVSVIWFSIFGGAGIYLQLGGEDIAGAGNEAAAFFATLQHYPFFIGAAIVVMVLTAVFFVSGADAGAVVLGTLSSRGRKEPWTPLVILWAVLTGAVAAVLLFVGGLNALQTFTILASTPFVLIIIGLCVSLYVDLRRDPLRQRRMGPVRGAVSVPTTAPFAVPTTSEIEVVDVDRTKRIDGSGSTDHPKGGLPEDTGDGRKHGHHA
ncbi:BCCT family transporter [Arthrobacter sulfonylureivorans]|uniref:BCCT family transporter n=1 Tax=Arthrobacter sulfonylureivorans TaxID=2486855 RepID=A0ABY3WD81_9MICC|nr:BCCT family transporter [Arthrobacter sulfonylureivorans]UNK46262.1 BCCT family transporter [Arthrobacter sulfonylureivorans]